MKKFLLLTAGSLLTIYALICLLLYFFQERFIFFPEPLAPDYRFRFSYLFSEVFIQTTDKRRLHALHFKAKNSKGVIFYLHGNAGSVRSWGEEAAMYTALNYDVLMPDYRGYGKSEGTISSEAQIYSDIQTVYNRLKEQYRKTRSWCLAIPLEQGQLQSWPLIISPAC
jgi:ribosome-associated translation inhibitor RaiA